MIVQGGPETRLPKRFASIVFIVPFSVLVGLSGGCPMSQPVGTNFLDLKSVRSDDSQATLRRKSLNYSRLPVDE